jgi:NifB/MoaA-like Fe-S oxidoreductase
VGVVPVGLTQYHRGQCRTYTPDESRAVLDQLEGWRIESREARGCGFVYPSDEWYLVAGREVPLAPEYDGFPQVENGVGMVRQLLDGARVLGGKFKAGVPAVGLRPATLVCGTLIAPVMARIVEGLGSPTAADVRVVPVVNQFFGPVTTVSGLLTGVDVVAALQARSFDSAQDRPFGEVVLLPRAMFTGRYGSGAAAPGTTLDGLTIGDISAQLGVRAEMAGTMTEALAVLERGGVP